MNDEKLKPYIVEFKLNSGSAAVEIAAKSSDDAVRRLIAKDKEFKRDRVLRIVQMDTIEWLKNNVIR